MSSRFQRCRWQYRSIFIRLVVVAAEICEIPRNSPKIRTYSTSRSSKVIDLGVNQKLTCHFLIVREYVFTFFFKIQKRVFWSVISKKRKKSLTALSKFSLFSTLKLLTDAFSVKHYTRVTLYTVSGKKRPSPPPKHVQITLWVENCSHYFSLYHEKLSICNVCVKVYDNQFVHCWDIAFYNKKAVLPQGNRAMPQVFFSVEVRQQHSLQV